MRPAIVVVASLIFSCYVTAYTVLAFAKGGSVDHIGEPLSGLFLPDDVLLENRPFLAEIATKDRQVRRGYTVPTHFDRRNVVVIIVDSLGTSRLSMYGYPRDTTPFLTDLWRKGRLVAVPGAMSMCPESVCGIISTLSSRDYGRLTPGLYKLNDVLMDAGYDIRFILSGAHSWNGLRKLYGDSVHSIVDGTSFDPYTVNDDRGVLAELEQVGSFAGQPTFFLLHLMAPHQLARAASYRETGSSALGRIRVFKDEALYEESIANADRTIRNVFQALQQKGYLRDALVVILGDHGEAFGEHGAYGHLDALYAENLRIPILIYDPKGLPNRLPKFSTQLDVAPTIVKRLGLPVPETWQGHSLFDRTPDTRVTYHQTTGRSPKYALHFFSDGRLYKLISAKTAPTPFDMSDQLYELIGDPLEKRNFIGSASPELLSFLQNQLFQYQNTRLPAGLGRVQ